MCRCWGLTPEAVLVGAVLVEVRRVWIDQVVRLGFWCKPNALQLIVGDVVHYPGLEANLVYVFTPLP